MEKTYLITMNGEELEALIMQCVRTVMSEITVHAPTQPRSNIGGIELAVRITGLAKATLYTLVSKRVIPHKKVRGRLYFDEHELEKWINQHHRKTILEIEQEANNYVNTRQASIRKLRR